MSQYELALVLTEAAGKDEAKLKQDLTETISKVKGKVKEIKNLGLRSLAYPIKQATKGWYSILQLELEGNQITELEKLFQAEEKILRYLLVRAG